MKIALYHNLTSGGSKREAYEFARQFATNGHVVHVYHPSTADESFLPLDEIVNSRFVFDLPLVPDLPLRVPGLTRWIDLAGWAVNLRRIRKLAYKIARQIDKGGYDFVLVHHDRIVQSPYLLRYLRTPSVYYCAEPMREFYEPPVLRPYMESRSWVSRSQRAWYAPTRWIRNAITRAEDRQNVRAAAQVVTNSNFSAQALAHAYGVQAQVVYLGVDTEKFRPLDTARSDFVLSVGAISPLKGFDLLIRALARIADGKRPRLVLVGNTASTGEKQYLQNLADENSVTVEFRVNVPDEELVRLYNQARVLVYAPVREPFGFAPLEAMACGTPIVAVREGGVCESVQDGVTGYLVPRDADEFARCLEGLLADESRARRMGASGRQRVLGFWTWGHAYGRLIERLKAVGLN